MPDVLVASDAAWVPQEVRQVLRGPDITLRWVQSGYEVLPAVRQHTPDIAVLDLQVGSMGGMAISLDLRLEEGMDRLPHVPILMLLDRRADVFLARRSQADGFVVKPLDPIRLRRAVESLLAGGSYEDASYRPVTVPPV